MSSILKGLQLNELSPQTLASYKKKAGADATAADKEGDYERGNKRFSGIVKATNKEFDNDVKQSNAGPQIKTDDKLRAYYAQRKAEKQGVEEGWQEDSQELEDWSKEVNKRLYRAHESQRPALARQLSKLEQKNFGSTLNQGGLTELIHSALRALQKGQMVHYDPQSVGQMPFGSLVGDDARIIAAAGVSSDELAGYRMLSDKGIVDNIQQFLQLRRAVYNKEWPQEYLDEFAGRPGALWLQFVEDLGWSKDDMNEAYNNYQSNRTGFSKYGKNMDDEANMMYRFDTADGKLKQRMVSNPERQSAFRSGFKDTPDEALRAHNIIRSKFDPKKFVQKQNNKWVPVFPFGQQDMAEEKQRLDPKCWTGYKKQGTKMKGGVRVNNCVPIKETNSSILEGIQQVDEFNWKHAAAAGALALGALGGAGHAQAADLSQYDTGYLQKVASGEGGRAMVSIDDAKAELQARANGKQQTTAPTRIDSPTGPSGFSKEYLQKAADPNRFGRFMISVEKAQELLKSMP